MPNPDHIARLMRGVVSWTAWRDENPTRADLSAADLIEAYLSGAKLREAKLSAANLGYARFIDADLGSE
jgi:uncharacterized protein YjbI with pentapeptide repeats